MRRAAVGFLILALAGCADESGEPPRGDDTAVTFRVEGGATEPAGPMIDPSAVLVLDEIQAEAAAANAPAEGAAQVIRDWRRYEERALVLVYGGTAPDAGHRVEVDGVAIDPDGLRLIVSAMLSAEDPALQVVSIPWTAVSVDAELVARVETCALTLDGREIPDAACSPAIPYASK